MCYKYDKGRYACQTFEKTVGTRQEIYTEQYEAFIISCVTAQQTGKWCEVVKCISTPEIIPVDCPFHLEGKIKEAEGLFNRMFKRHVEQWAKPGTLAAWEKEREDAFADLFNKEYLSEGYETHKNELKEGFYNLLFVAIERHTGASLESLRSKGLTRIIPAEPSPSTND